MPLKKAAKVRLENLGLVKRHGFFINNPKRLERHRERLEMTRSLGLVQAMERQEAEESREAEKLALAPVVGDAIKMYSEGKSGGRGFQKKHARAILVSVFGVCPKKSLSKGELMISLEEEARRRPGLIDSYEIADDAPALPPALPPFHSRL